jgi:hypothetical protein
MASFYSRSIKLVDSRKYNLESYYNTNNVFYKSAIIDYNAEFRSTAGNTFILFPVNIRSVLLNSVIVDIMGNTSTTGAYSLFLCIRNTENGAFWEFTKSIFETDVWPLSGTVSVFFELTQVLTALRAQALHNLMWGYLTQEIALLTPFNLAYDRPAEPDEHILAITSNAEAKAKDIVEATKLTRLRYLALAAGVGEGVFDQDEYAQLSNFIDPFITAISANNITTLDLMVTAARTFWATRTDIIPDIALGSYIRNYKQGNFYIGVKRDGVAAQNNYVAPIIAKLVLAELLPSELDSRIHSYDPMLPDADL